MIIGTVHGFHFSSPVYHPDALRHLLSVAKPDVLALEIRPDDVNPPHYGFAPADIRLIAIPWAHKRYVPFRPIDWFQDDIRDRHHEMMAELEKTEAGRAKLAAVGSEMDPHSDRCRHIELCPPAYLHSAQFAERELQFRQGAAKAFGEGPGNMFWTTRAGKMSELLDGVLEEFENKRIVVVSGAAHRGDFERALAGREGVRLIPVMSLPGATKLPPYSGVEGGPRELQLMLLTTVQGMKANRAPDQIDLAHVRSIIERAKVIGADVPWFSTVIRFAQAEAAYLAKDYQGALSLFDDVAKTGDARAKGFGLSLTIFCELRAANMLDLLGQREPAVARYEALAAQGDHIGRLSVPVQQYLKAPYHRPGSMPDPAQR